LVIAKFTRTFWTVERFKEKKEREERANKRIGRSVVGERMNLHTRRFSRKRVEEVRD